MAYIPYYNGYQPPYYQPPMADQLAQLRQQTAAPQSSSPIIWVQGEAAARAYMVAAGNSVLLMDSDASVFYLKSTDSSGMPQPMRIFDYTERTSKKDEIPAVAAEEYVTRKEFEALSERMNILAENFKEVQTDAESVV